MKLARPQRRLFYSIAFIALWCSVAFFLLQPTSYAWRANIVSGMWGDAEWSFGLLKYLTIEYRDVDLKGAPAGPNPGVTWDWAPPSLAMTVLALVFMAAICRTGFLVTMRKERLVGQCDECGYDLTGLRSSRCPECGTPVDEPQREAAE